MFMLLPLLLLAAAARAITYQGTQLYAVESIVMVGSALGPPVLRNGSRVEAGGLFMADIAGWPLAQVRWTPNATEALQFRFARATICFPGGCLRAKRIKRMGNAFYIGLVPRQGSAFGY